eukprot:5449570-Prymnesium_polylepis.1
MGRRATSRAVRNVSGTSHATRTFTVKDGPASHLGTGHRQAPPPLLSRQLPRVRASNWPPTVAAALIHRAFLHRAQTTASCRPTSSASSEPWMAPGAFRQRAAARCDARPGHRYSL